MIQTAQRDEEVRASFPNQIHKSSHTNNIQIYPNEMNMERDAGAAAWGTEQFTDAIQKPQLT